MRFVHMKIPLEFIVVLWTGPRLLHTQILNSLNEAVPAPRKEIQMQLISHFRAAVILLFSYWLTATDLKLKKIAE